MYKDRFLDLMATGSGGLGLDDLLLASPRRDSITPLDEILVPLNGPLAREAISQALAAAFAPSTDSSTIESGR